MDFILPLLLLARLGTKRYFETWSDNAIHSHIAIRTAFGIILSYLPEVYNSLEFMFPLVLHLILQFTPEDILELLQSLPFSQQLSRFIHLNNNLNPHAMHIILVTSLILIYKSNSWSSSLELHWEIEIFRKCFKFKLFSKVRSGF